MKRHDGSSSPPSWPCSPWPVRCFRPTRIAAGLSSSTAKTRPAGSCARTSITVTKFVDGSGKEIKGARKAKLDQKETIVNAKGKPIEGAKVAKVDGKNAVVDAQGKPIPGAKIAKTGGRDAIVGPDGKELKDAKAVSETLPNPTGGWQVPENGLLRCGNGPRGSDLFTEQKFGDFQLHIEFLGTSNSGVYLQGRYEIQVDNSFKAKPKIEEVNGKKVEVFSKTQCGALYGQIAPSKNMAKPPTEWQTFDITFTAARGEKGKATRKARITLVWNGEKVLDNVEVPNGTAQSIRGRSSFRGTTAK